MSYSLHWENNMRPFAGMIVFILQLPPSTIRGDCSIREL